MKHKNYNIFNIFTS